MSTAFPGQGQPLYLASSNPREPVWPQTAVIPNGSKTLGVAMNAGMQTNISVRYNAAPGTATTIEYSDDPTFDQVISLDTLPAGADLIAVWQSNVTFPGFCRINNTSGAQINHVTFQQVVASVG